MYGPKPVPTSPYLRFTICKTLKLGEGFPDSGLTDRPGPSCNFPEGVLFPREAFAAMPTTAILEDLIDALEEQSDSLLAYLDRDTGEVILISEESLSLAEEEPEEIASLPDWQKEEVELAVQIQSTDRYLALPDQFDVNEWEIMREFSEEAKPDDIRAALLRVIRGDHAFRRFKDQIATHNMWDPWNRFRRHAFEEIVRDWCEENAINLTVRQKQSAQHEG